MRCVYCGCETGTTRSHTREGACRTALRKLLADILATADATWEELEKENDLREVEQEVREVLRVSVDKD